MSDPIEAPVPPVKELVSADEAEAFYRGTPAAPPDDDLAIDSDWGIPDPAPPDPDPSPARGRFERLVVALRDSLDVFIESYFKLPIP